MNITSPYWSNTEFQQVLSTKPLTGNLGFQFRLPWPEPVTVGAMYFGSGARPDRRELTTLPYGEYFAINNTVPSTGGQPLININEPRFKYSRERYTFKV
jgi:hypothetical protein